MMTPQHVPSFCSFIAFVALFSAISAIAADPPQENKKLPVPDSAAKEKAQTMVRDVFSKDIDKAKTPAEQIALAEKLMKVAEETTNDPPARFMLSQLALETATKAGDI